MGFLDKLVSKVARSTTASPPKPAAPAPVPAKPAAPAPAPGRTTGTTPVKTAAPVRTAAPAPVRTTAPAPAKAAAPAPLRVTASSSLPFLSSNKAPTGPLDLVKGDAVIHYRERFAVVGVRVLEGDGVTSLHYCLKDSKGGVAVIACEGGGSETTYSLQRAVKADIKWDAEVVNCAGDEPLRLVKKGQMKVRAWDDAGLATGVRSMEYRRFADASGDKVVALEDYQSKREVRVGEPVFEAEMEIERGGGGKKAGSMTAAMNRAKAFEDVGEDEVVKGTPQAAAKALEQNMGSTKMTMKAAAADHDPTAYDDETWVDAEDDQPAKQSRHAKVATRPGSSDEDEEDEWVSASQLVRQNGEITGDDDDPGLKR